MKETGISIESGELLLSGVLRVGVLASALIIVVGIVLLFATLPQTGYFGQGLQGMIAYPPQARAAPIDRSVGEVLNGLRVREPDAVISLGLLVLVATPIVRVAASVVLFFMQRDYRYVVITTFVLIVLLISLQGGAAG